MAPGSMIRLSPRWSSGAVLQHGCPQPLSGKAAPAQLLQITLQTTNQLYQAEIQTDALGEFSITLPPQQPSGPWTLSITAGVADSITLNDLWFGELLLFAGQSNVGWPLARYPDQLAAAQQQLAAMSGNHCVRCYLSDPSDFRAAGAWQPLDSHSCPIWPALLYHFSQQLDNAPIMYGLVDLSWPGSAISAWLPASDSNHDRPWQNGALFSARLAPWLRQPFQSLIWYQGEQDAMGREGGLYAGKLRSWFDSCRQLAGWQFPLVLVQIAGFGANSRPDLANGFVQVRQAQQQFAAGASNCVLVSAADLGAVQDIHPPFKAELARRLVLALPALIRGEATCPWQATLQHSSTGTILQLPVQANTAGWQSRTIPLTGFYYEDSTGRIQQVPAILSHDGQQVSLQLPDNARLLLYGMAAQPELSLYSAQGEPMLPQQWPLHRFIER